MTDVTPAVVGFPGPPEDWDEVDTVMSNFDGYVDRDAEDKLRDRSVWGRHPGWEFNGRVWYADGLFHEQVWRYHVPIDYKSAATLNELMHAVNDEWGWD